MLKLSIFLATTTTFVALSTASPLVTRFMSPNEKAFGNEEEEVIATGKLVLAQTAVGASLLSA